MAEMDAALEHAPAVPSATPDDQAPVFDLAVDLTPNDVSAGSSSGTPASASVGAESPAFDPSRVDLVRADAATLPPEWQKAQAYVRNLQSSYDRQVQELRSRVQQASVQQSASQTAAETAAAIARQQNPPDPYADLRSRLPEGDDASIDVVRDIFHREINPYASRMEQYESQLQQATQALRGVANWVQQIQAGHLQQDVDRARELFGASFVNEYVGANRQAVSSKMQEVNPTTGRPFTLVEAIEGLSGKKPGSQEQASQAAQEARRTAQSAIAPNGTPAARGALNTQPRTDEDLFALAEAMGFGPAGSG